MSNRSTPIFVTSSPQFAFRFLAVTIVLFGGVSGTAIGESSLRWSIKLPVRQTKWQHVRDMQKDTTYRPTAAGELVFIGCEHNGALLAVDAMTGNERWRFYSQGAIRTQPVADEAHVAFGSDDGYVYCLDHQGKLRWKSPVGLGSRFVIGHQRLTSAWPVPTHPLLADGKLYILGGCWPADGVFMNAFDITTGTLLWKSPSMHMRAMMIPHWIHDGHVYVRTYSGTGGKAARFDIETGNASYWPKGTEVPKSEPVDVPGASDLTGSNKSNGLRFGSGKDGTVYCAGPHSKGEPRHHVPKTASPAGNTDAAKAIVEAAKHADGFALVSGLTDGTIVEGLLRNSDLYVVAVDADAAKVDRIRRELDGHGCFDGHRLSVLSLELADDMLPPYFASIVLSESGEKPSDIALRSRRPYGGASVYRVGNRWQAEHRGELPGAGNWSHEYANASMNNSTADRLVRAPLGVLWYGGPASDKEYYLSGNRPAGALVVDGRMFLQGNGVVAGVDAYTGRLLWESEIPTMHIYNGTHGGGGGGLGQSNPWEDEKAAAKGIPPIMRPRATGLNWAAASDCVYLFAADECFRFDPATGENLSTWKMPLPKVNDEELCWGCPRIVDDIVVATAFLPSDMRDARIGIDGNGGDWAGDRMPMKFLFAVDRQTGKVIWSQRANFGFNNRAFVAANDRVFCTDLLQTRAVEGFLEAKRKLPNVPAAVRAFDLRSGKEVWKFELDNLVKYLTFSEKDDMLLVPNRYGRVWTGKGWGWPGLSERETRSKSGRPNGIFRAFRGKTGELLWEISEQHYDGPFSVIGNQILNRYGTSFDPKTGKLAMRLSPVTGAEESYGFRKRGCAVLGGCDSIVAWRTAYHDMTTGASTQLPGFEAGCTTSLLPAGGMLNLPNFGMFHLRARTAAVSMVHRPSSRPWSSFQLTKLRQEISIQRIGYNLGAPGDRYDEHGTLWIQAYQGGTLRISVEPKESPWFVTGNDKDWIAQSGVEDLTKIRLPTAINQKSSKTVRRYNVHLHFSSRGAKAGERVFEVLLEGESVLANFDVAKAGSSRVVRSFKNVEIAGPLEIEFRAKAGKPILCGVELEQSNK